MVTVEELNFKILQLKAQEHSLEEASKVTHDELMLAIGELKGYQRGLQDATVKVEVPK